MRKILQNARFFCRFCGSRKYYKNLFHVFENGSEYFSCKNEDMCVLKMSYNKKVKCKTKKQ